jgi:hypothetical protein
MRSIFEWILYTIIQCAIDPLPDLRFRQVCKDVSNRSLTESRTSDQSLRNLRTLVAPGSCPSLKKGIAVCLWTLRSCSIMFYHLCFLTCLTHVVLFCLLLFSMPFFKEDCQLKQLLYRCRKIHQRFSVTLLVRLMLMGRWGISSSSLQRHGHQRPT